MGALLMLAPLVAVPILAVVGIPQFAPGNLIDPNGSKQVVSSRDSRAFAEPRFGDAARHDADDLFAPLDESGSDVHGFDDPLDSRKVGSRDRNPQAEEFEEFEEEAPRPRSRKSPAFENDADAEFGEAPPADQYDSEVSPKSRPNSRRPRSGSQTSPDEFDDLNNQAQPFDELADVGSADGSMTHPRGEADPDDSATFGGGRPKGSGRRTGPRDLAAPAQEPLENAPQGDAEGNPFEAAPPVQKAPRQPDSRPKTQPRSRDPHDAPIFQPQESAPGEQLADAGSFAPPPVQKKPNTGKRATQPVIPPDPPEEAPEQETTPAVTEEEQVPGVNELTWQEATKRLRALGVGKSKQYFTYLEDSNSFLFTCSAIHMKDAKKTLRFEAEAEEPLLAVSQVLDKLEAWQSASPQRRVADRGQE
jgi:hypothetical protein